MASMPSQTFSKVARSTRTAPLEASSQTCWISSSVRSSGRSPRNAAIGGSALKDRTSTPPLGGLAQYSAVVKSASISFGSVAEPGAPSVSSRTVAGAAAVACALAASYICSTCAGDMFSICFCANFDASAICSGERASICRFIISSAAGFALSMRSDVLRMSGFAPDFFISSFCAGVITSICCSIMSICSGVKSFIADAAIFICSGVIGPPPPPNGLNEWAIVCGVFVAVGTTTNPSTTAQHASAIVVKAAKRIISSFFAGRS
mmetsp:Transcript_26366/g.81114  ORF Transcript_26366/g.81114 Transcript_26366/m.81114 type:complete len:263 (+) Transcript_26366:286-1074(+)